MNHPAIKVFFRPMKLGDISAVKDLNERSMPENYPREYWLEKFPLGRDHSFVAVFAGSIIGYVFCNYSDESKCGHIMSFAVDEAYRGKGIGGNLLYHCMNTFKDPVSLHVRVSNKTALNMYKGFGFVITGELVEYYRNPAENAYSMERPIMNVKYPSVREIKVKK